MYIGAFQSHMLHLLFAPSNKNIERVSSLINTQGESPLNGHEIIVLMNNALFTETNPSSLISFHTLNAIKYGIHCDEYQNDLEKYSVTSIDFTRLVALCAEHSAIKHWY